MLAHALAAQTKRRLYAIRASDIFTMWYGQSNKRLAQIFEVVRLAKNAVLFFDEADGLISTRSHSGTHEESIRVINQFCVQMEALTPEDNVTVVLATNLRERLDEAAVRAKRIDYILTVGLPDLGERFEILRVHAIAAMRKAKRLLFEKGIDWNALAVATANFSGADLAAIIDRVLEQKAVAQARGQTPSVVSQQDLFTALDSYRAERKMKSRRLIGY